MYFSKVHFRNIMYFMLKCCLFLKIKSIYFTRNKLFPLMMGSLWGWIHYSTKCYQRMACLINKSKLRNEWKQLLIRKFSFVLKTLKINILNFANSEFNFKTHAHFFSFFFCACRQYRNICFLCKMKLMYWK